MMAPKPHGWLSRPRVVALSSLAFVLLLVASFALTRALADTLGTITTQNLKQQVTDIVPALQVRADPTRTSGSVNGTLLTLNPGTGTFATTNAPTWAASTGWNYTDLGDDGWRCNLAAGGTCAPGFASFPWLNHSSYIQIEFGGGTTDSISGLCLLCTNSATAASGIVARLRRVSAGGTCSATITRWCMELGHVDTGTFTLWSTQDVGTVNDRTYLRLWYTRTDDTVHATFNAGAALTNVVSATYNTNTYAGTYSGSTTSIRYGNSALIPPRFEAGYCVESLPNCT